MIQHKIHSFLALDAGARRLLAQASLLLPLTAVGLRLFGFNYWYTAVRRLAGHPSKPPAPDAAQSQARLTARLVNRAGRLGLFQANCLQRSLVLWYLLRRQGIESDLRIGVRKDASRLNQLPPAQVDLELLVPAPPRVEAHAWVERSGVVLNDRADISQRFTPFERAILPAGVEELTVNSKQLTVNLKP